MNKVILMGRLTRDPEVRYSTSGDNQLAIARYTLAVDFAETETSRRQILSAAWHSAEAASLQKSISIREQKL